MNNPNPIKFIPKTPADGLALEIAKNFKDEVHLPLYQQICSGHNQSLVYRAYRIVMRMPITKIKKSRRALLIYFVKKYDEKA